MIRGCRQRFGDLEPLQDIQDPRLDFYDFVSECGEAVHQGVRAVGRNAGIALMDAFGQHQVAGSAVRHIAFMLKRVPKPAALDDHWCNSVCCIGVAAGGVVDLVQGLISIHVSGQVTPASALDHVVGALQQRITLPLGSASGRCAGDQTLEHPAGLDQNQVFCDANLAHPQASARLLLDEPTGNQFHQRFAYGRAPQTSDLDQFALDDGLIGLEFERGDHALYGVVCDFGCSGLYDGCRLGWSVFSYMMWIDVCEHYGVFEY